tara:strand:+ start:2290 stop:2829 length:540 start_codon:yes stop_codon:yes gene_type:complete
MRALPLIYVLFLTVFAFSQNEDSKDLLIYDLKDSTFLLIGKQHTEIKGSFNMLSYDMRNTDSIVGQLNSFYRFEVPYNIDSNIVEITDKIYLDSITFSHLLNQAHLFFKLPKFGLGVPEQSDKLVKKYSVKYEPAGCTYYPPTPNERIYYERIYKLLLIRNGVDWKAQYQKDSQKSKFK